MSKRLSTDPDPDGVRVAAQMIADHPERVNPKQFSRALAQIHDACDDTDEWDRALNAVDDAARAVAAEHHADIARVMGE